MLTALPLPRAVLRMFVVAKTNQEICFFAKKKKRKRD